MPPDTEEKTENPAPADAPAAPVKPRKLTDQEKFGGTGGKFDPQGGKSGGGGGGGGGRGGPGGPGGRGRGGKGGKGFVDPGHP
ncbi:MAG: hypothetical protein ACYCWW_15235 [Deltaproteobacteria bacterium]